jgi:hypothetical protein
MNGTRAVLLVGMALSVLPMLHARKVDGLTIEASRGGRCLHDGCILAKPLETA